MLVKWYKGLPKSSPYRNGKYNGPVDEASTNAEMCKSNAGFRPDFISSLARLYKFRIAQYVTDGASGIEPWLALSTGLLLTGPFWYGGQCAGYRGKSGGGHVVVITGIDTERKRFKINDPDPVGQGTTLDYDCRDFFKELAPLSQPANFLYIANDNHATRS